MKAPNTTSDRKANSIDDVLKECDRLLHPTVISTMEELARVHQDAVHCLLSLGPEFDAIREKVEELRFNPSTTPIWRLARTGQRIDAIVPSASWDAARFNEHVTAILNQLKELMLINTSKYQFIF